MHNTVNPAGMQQGATWRWTIPKANRSFLTPPIPAPNGPIRSSKAGWVRLGATFWRQKGYGRCGQHRTRSSHAGWRSRSGDGGTTGRATGRIDRTCRTGDAQRRRGHATRGRGRRCRFRLSGGEIPPPDGQLHAPHDPQSGGRGGTGARSISCAFIAPGKAMLPARSSPPGSIALRPTWR